MHSIHDRPSRVRATFQGVEFLSNDQDEVKESIDPLKSNLGLLERKSSSGFTGNQSTMAERTDVFTLSQVAQHKSKKDGWLVVNGRVLSVTNFLKEHPGGEEVILESAGKDVTKEFQDMGHSRAAQSLLLQYQVGVLQGCQAQDPADSNAGNTPFNGPAKKEMSAFVIKDEPASKHAALLEFFIPLLVAGSYFTYRYITVLCKFDQWMY